MGAPPLVSVAMSMYNASGTLAAALRSLRLQTLRDWELILLDDGSADDSVEIARLQRDERIDLTVDGQRKGLPARLNLAVSVARGRYLARMDADDIAYPERFERQIAFLEAHPEVDLLGTGGIAFRGAGQPLGLLPVRTTHEDICAAPWSGFSLAHPTWMGRREWFRRSAYRACAKRCEDQDLLLRTYRDSRFACLPEPLLGYRQERVSVQNLATGRLHYARALWHAGMAREDWGLALRGVATQGTRAVVATAMAAGGGGDRVLRRRFAAASEAQLAQWQQVWAEASRTRDRAEP
jgi:glycosyltransferase involved in cell wall biosynthesis